MRADIALGLLLILAIVALCGAVGVLESKSCQQCFRPFALFRRTVQPSRFGPPFTLTLCRRCWWSARRASEVRS